ncbi:hypothetical protein [Salinicola halophilus]|uniref:hypothetical protein n=1 Tax=Salinicola halophilus TaxID=184065 RepID=UPI0013A5FDC9|nr:hypothetical protein [Salinicola halophilus]
MKAFNRFFSQIAAVLVSALLPLFMVGESQASSHQSGYSESSIPAASQKESEDESQ